METLFIIILVVLVVGGFVTMIGGEIEKEREKERRRKAREEKYRRRQLERQMRYAQWQRLRHEFDELKKTEEFRRWKNEEYLCQDKKCAWCKRPIGLHTQYTHVDHIEPLFYGGDNSASNLVLTCSACNKAKGYKTRGYNDNWDGDKYNRVGRNARPSWIAVNKYDDELDGSGSHLDNSKL